MSDLVQVLLEHMERTRLPDLLYANGYWSTARQSEPLRKQFRETLSMEQRDRLEVLLAQENTLHTREVEATFQSGVSLGLELSRL